MLIDTHAHIHFDEYKNDLEEVLHNCVENKVAKIITVGTDEQNSKDALEFCYKNDFAKIQIYASAGIHPHDAERGDDSLLTLKELVIDGGYSDRLVAIGECGLDYYRNNSSRSSQIRALEFQLQLALENSLPVIFHVRDAWDDFFAVLKNFQNIRGVIHSFTGTKKEVDLAQAQNLYFGLNGIMTFTKIQDQLDAAKYIAKEYLLLETDCPFLSPEPKRGKRNEPANLKYTAEFLAKLRGDTYTEICEYTTTNAITLFGLK